MNLLIPCLLLFPALSAAPSPGPNKPVWRIGSFDRMSAEFAGGLPEKPVTFLAGESDPAKDWNAVQPVEPSTPSTIRFSLHAPLPASYRLHVALLLNTASVPSLVVSINGKRGQFFLEPRSNTEAGEHNGASDAVTAHADVQFDFPASYLHEGDNTISLQAAEPGKQFVPDAGFSYDAIELDSSSSRVDREHSTLRILPTIFYQQQELGLAEMVDCFVLYRRHPAARAAIDLTIGRYHGHQAIPQDHDFGEEKLEFAVPQFSALVRARASWNVNGHPQHLAAQLAPAKKWTLFLIPHIHLDVGYTDYQAKVAAIQSRVIDEVLQLSSKHSDFRFSLDGEWSLEQFLKARTSSQQGAAISSIQKQQLFVPAQYANLLTGFSTAEVLIRSLYPSATFSRLHGTPFDYANLTDVPSPSWSYASVLASAGIHQLLDASDNFRAPVFFAGHLNERSPMWWQGPDGEKVLLWFARHYQQVQFVFGLPPIAVAGRETLPWFLQQYEQPTYRANATIVFGTQAENSDLFPQQAELAGQWNSLYAYPHLQYSGVHDALASIVAQFGNTLPTVHGDGGPYWEDGIASDARFAAMERQNESRGPSAETLSTVASLIDPHLSPAHPDLAAMWSNMLLMDEHTWDSSDSVVNPASSEAVDQLAVKDQHAVAAEQLGESVIRSSMASIADSIAADANSLVVFNTLNWKRSQLVSIDVENWRAQIVDVSTGKVVRVEVVGGGKDFRRVRFLAENVPAVGYKVYRLRETEQPPEPIPAEQQTTLENSYYRVKLDRESGAIQSIFDKDLRRELVDQKSSWRFGQYLYVTGGDQPPNALLQYSQIYPKPKIDIHPALAGSLVSVTRTPWGIVARMESSATNTPGIATEVRLFNGEKKIELEALVEKTEVDTKEAVYFAFPFAMDHPKFQYEIQDGVVDPARDLLPGACYEWFSAQHWVSVEQNGVAAVVMPLDASLVTLGDVNRGAWPSAFGARPGSIFSYVMNNYWTTNYRAGQGGSFRFRYVITSAQSTDAAQSSRAGWQEMTPLETDRISSQDRAQTEDRPLSGTAESFLGIDDPSLVLTAWKAAEDGRGTILRFLDLGGPPRTVNVATAHLPIDEAWQTDAVERDQQRLPLLGRREFQFGIHPHQIVTIRLLSHPAALAPSGRTD